MGLQENLKMAASVAGEVREKVPNSSNYAWTSSPVQRTGGNAPQPSFVDQAISFVSSFVTTPPVPVTGMGMHEVSSSAIDVLRSRLDRELPKDYNAWVRSFEQIKALCYMTKFGNCGELSAIACLLLCEQRVTLASPSPIEYVQIWDGVTNNPVLPHLIAVIGRNPNQLTCMRLPIGLPNQWHANSVVCDPWDRVIYAAHDYYNFWDGLRDASKRPEALTCKLLCQM